MEGLKSNSQWAWVAPKEKLLGHVECAALLGR